MFIYFSSECLPVSHRNDTKPRSKIPERLLVQLCCRISQLYLASTVSDMKSFVIYEKHLHPVSAVG